MFYHFLFFQMFKRNMKTRPSEDFDENEERLELEAPEISREEDRSVTGIISLQIVQ